MKDDVDFLGVLVFLGVFSGGLCTGYYLISGELGPLKVWAVVLGSLVLALTFGVAMRSVGYSRRGRR